MRTYVKIMLGGVLSGKSVMYQSVVPSFANSGDVHIITFNLCVLYVQKCTNHGCMEIRFLAPCQQIFLLTPDLRSKGSCCNFTSKDFLI